MSDYTIYKRGSEWRKWDLHVHTPGTLKADNYTGGNTDAGWDKFCEDINNSAEEIAVIGVTDYLLLDNYKKFVSLVKSGKITKKFDLIIPNIELRISPVTSKGRALNLHLLIDPAFVDQVEERIYSKLVVKDGATTEYTAQRSGLIRLAKKSDPTLDDDRAYKEGAKKFIIDFDTLIGVFDRDSDLHNHCIIVVANSAGDGASGIEHSAYFTDGKSDMVEKRTAFYRFANAIFSGAPKDALYFVGKGVDDRKAIETTCGSLMPCIHGSDAHENAKLFKPDLNRFCWIKANPTFEGLKQILYEPEGRVKIQANKPDIKIDRNVISELRFIDRSNKFGNQVIYLNENLNAIIGGKSSGKSLLLYAAAKSIDPEQVDRTSSRLKFEGYKFDFDFEVTWKSGEKDLYSNQAKENKAHKITYIPQLYINHLVEKDNKDDLNTLIQTVLLQNSEFKSVFETKHTDIQRINSQIEDFLRVYFQLRTKGLETNKSLSEVGKSSAIQTSIDKLTEELAKGQASSNLTEEEYNIFLSLNKSKTEDDAYRQGNVRKAQVLQNLISELETVRSEFLGSSLADGTIIKGTLQRVFDEFGEPTADMVEIGESLSIDFRTMLSNLKSKVDGLKIAAAIEELEKKISATDNSLKPLLSKLKEQGELQKLSKQIESEKVKLEQAKALESSIKLISQDYVDTNRKIVELLNQRTGLYNELITLVNTKMRDIGNEVFLSAKLVYSKEDFPLIEQTNKSQTSGDNILYSLFNDEGVKYEKVIEVISKGPRFNDGKFIVSDTESIPLRLRVGLEDVYKGLVKDGFKLDFTVTYKGDDLLSMSPGKKGTVLLILFLQINSSEYPILIDQPEDNLDNRTIYDLLCQMIKGKKSERQIIIVSHNANLVVSTDAENIIVANQAGQETDLKPGETTFSYVNGALEHSFPYTHTEPSILLSQGIREHVCDILEGGNEAFKQRERKYSIN